MIDPQCVKLSALPSVPLTRLKSLPSCSGIYFVSNASDEILYIGRSNNIRNRWQQHHKHYQLKQLEDIRIVWLEISDDFPLNEMEVALIEWFNPSLNRADLSDLISCSRKGGIKICLKEIRKKRGLSQKRLAESINMSLQNIQNIEYGEAKSIPLETLDKLCAVLKCQVGDLLIYVPDEEGQENDRSSDPDPNFR